jgi:hypothetical protein
MLTPHHEQGIINGASPNPWLEWMTEMRSVQLEVGTGALSNVRLVEELLFNMDPELRRELRRDVILKGTGLTEYPDSRPQKKGYSLGASAITLRHMYDWRSP